MATVTTPIATDATLQNIDTKLGTMLTKMDALAAAFQPNAAGIDYSNTTSGLTADDVQEAIDENAGAITEIKQSLSDLEDSLEDSYTNLSLNSSIVNTIYIRNIFKFGNIKIANVGYLSKAISTLNTWYELCTLPTGYENLHALEFQWFTRDKKSINIKVENNKIWIVARESVGNNDLINVYIPFI